VSLREKVSTARLVHAQGTPPASQDADEGTSCVSLAIWSAREDSILRSEEPASLSARSLIGVPDSVLSVDAGSRCAAKLPKRMCNYIRLRWCYRASLRRRPPRRPRLLISFPAAGRLSSGASQSATMSCNGPGSPSGARSGQAAEPRTAQWSCECARFGPGPT
jgi:hypothetical protein